LESLKGGRLHQTRLDGQKKVLSQAGLVSTKHAATIFGVTERTVRRWLASGRMPQQVQAGRERKFCKEAIEAEIKMDVF
jgi:excisionase family DNA binding protein